MWKKVRKPKRNLLLSSDFVKGVKVNGKERRLMTNKAATLVVLNVGDTIEFTPANAVSEQQMIMAGFEKSRPHVADYKKKEE